MNDEEIIKEVHEGSCMDRPHASCLYCYDELIDCMTKAREETLKDVDKIIEDEYKLTSELENRASIYVFKQVIRFKMKDLLKSKEKTS